MFNITKKNKRKLLTSSTTIIEGVPGNYTMITTSDTIDPAIKIPVDRKEVYPNIDKLSRDFAQQLENTINMYFHEGHEFKLTLKDYLKK